MAVPLKPEIVMAISKPHIVFVCSRLDQPGGTERATVNLASLLHDKGHKITLVILDETASCFYELRNGIRVLQEYLHFGITAKGNKISRKVDFYLHIRKLKSL